MNAQTTPLAVGSARAPGHAYLGGAKSPEMMIAVRQKLLDLALKNGRRSVPLLVLAGCLEAWLGWNAGARGMAVAIVIVSCVLGAWRFFLGRRDVVGSAARENDRTEIELAGNSLLAGILWASMSIGIYPSLDPQAAGVHIMMLLGSAAIAAHFMTLVRWSYALLVIPSIGSLSLVSMFDRSVHSYALGFLSVFYMATLLLAGRAYRKTATQAIEHALVADAAVESLKKAKDDAEAGLVAKSQFLATMSHEIRTPMNGVLGSLELLRRSGLNPEQQRLARTASSSGSALMAILNDVLDHSKIEAGKLALTTAPVSLHAQMASVVGLFRSNAEARGLSLHLHVDEAAADWVLADGQRLKQVLLNLVSNAIKFTEHGRVALSVKALSSSPGNARLLFAVSDTGVGMSADSLQRLFSPFTQLDGPGHPKRRGTGLGLSISQRIVEAMGGCIEVESTPGEGSCFGFTLELPRHDAEPPPVAAETSAGELDGLNMTGGATVLVAEDEPVNRLIARSMLESLGFRVIEAADGLEALAKAHMHTVDLVLMDCQMPNLDGYAAARQWRERERRLGLPRTPIVALTANAFEDDIRKSREAGMDAHLSKPYTRSQLREQMRQWLYRDETLS